MYAVYAQSIEKDAPLKGLGFGELPEPAELAARPGWTTVTLKAAALNHHDLWSLRGVGLPAERLPMILGCDGAGVDEDGNEVVVHAVLGEHGRGVPEGERPSILTERYPGTFAERLAVPRWNLLPKPAGLGFAEAACLPTAWLTAYRMLFTRSGLRPGDSVLVQGAGGGVATALIVLARAAGFRVWATSRSEAKRARALELGAHQAFESGARLPERVDAVMETVGAATWAHSVASVREEGTIVISGATSGPNPPAALTRIFFHQLRVVGSTMGSRDELAALLRFCENTGVRPVIDSVLSLREDAEAGFAKMAAGELVGKIVFEI
ncbi:zinc-binding dehydrogenase [Actinospica sp. MGRD01-02]|uniref:Zinc-binding dehydrogenase n=1 Tax=Actinospica acidithermotolerans TaxID=2828514 RepID=A0A941EFN2_9ACTN|nr:zinc-binding dehydrogenase [Actinospica acidithermotolerans]MBR7829868.1 zinc-binding dehydrogenase [Actinospica acidithermotolerans]